ncbi:hypothetical protein ACOME3_009101 [Neoechinorhynchus agilis]
MSHQGSAEEQQQQKLMAENGTNSDSEKRIHDCNWYRKVRTHLPSALMEPNKGEQAAILIDANIYSVKKTVMTILCLIIIILLNSVQLRNVSKEGITHPFYKSQLALGVISVMLTSLIGMILMYTARVNYNNQYKQRKLDFIGNSVIILLFVLAIFNIFIVACN